MLGCLHTLQLAGIKRHKELSFVLQPKSQVAASTNSRGGPSDSEDSSTHKKAPRSKKVSQLQTSPLSNTSFEGSETTDHEVFEETTMYNHKRQTWLHHEAGQSSPRGHPELYLATSCMPSPVQLVVDMSPRTPPPSSSLRAAKRRKGIPHRAPLRAWNSSSSMCT